MNWYEFSKREARLKIHPMRMPGFKSPSKHVKHMNNPIDDDVSAVPAIPDPTPLPPVPPTPAPEAPVAPLPTDVSETPLTTPPEIPGVESEETPPEPSPERIPITSITPDMYGGKKVDLKLHDNCHCYIDWLPSGRGVWKANDNACKHCLQLRDEYNQTQEMKFPTGGAPATVQLMRNYVNSG